MTSRVAPTVGKLESELLEAKLTVPHPRRGSVHRADLIDTARAAGCRVVGITAPAGYGKSTLMAEWAEIEDRRVAWVSLDRLDDDPAALLFLLASAYAKISGLPDVIAAVSGPGVSALGRAAPRLASALRTSSVPFVLMLDDLQELRSPDCHDVLSVVISGVPQGSQLVAASRSEQPHLPRLRAAADAVDFAVGDLALDEAAAEDIFAAAHVPITHERAAELTARTEGWPVGLQLAALIASDSGGDVSTITGDDRFVADYLYRESMMHLPEGVQQFLRRTAVLDQLSAPLCDATVDEWGAQSRLRDLEASSLFLVPLDRRRGWYRYHALYREFLLGELRRVEPDIIVKLHLRAADWYESNGSPVLALEHLLNTTEQERCVQLLSSLVLPTFQSGQLVTVQRWLSTLGDRAIQAYPPLAVLAGWMAVLTGQTADAHRWAAFLDTVSFDLVPLDGTGSFESARAMLHALMCRAGPEQMVEDADFAVAAEPPWSGWRATALSLSAEAQLLVGNAERATALFVATSAVAAELGNVTAISLSHAELALLAMDNGRWAEAAENVQLAVGIVEEYRLHDYAMSLLVFAAAARLALHRGDRREVDRQLGRAMRYRPSCTFALPYVAARARLQLAKVFVGIADQAIASHLLREIDEILLQRPALGALGIEISEFRVVINNKARARVAGGSPLTPAELRLLPYLQTHLSFKEIGLRLFVSRNTVSSEVGSIYRKLGVSSRSDAVNQATALGLLGE
ncbi:MAG TPA: LuxR C-terminal-related transcriptional regulator [Propionibacteriaceae bacterium]|nr:LuxR C-terminal-related transcriptional regulator [Propionibacteriaceae bacterium]